VNFGDQEPHQNLISDALAADVPAALALKVDSDLLLYKGSSS
jgi:hypothetical protein